MNGELDGEVVYGGLSCMLYKLKSDNYWDLAEDIWEENVYSNNIVELFNSYPRIIVDMCNHSDIGAKKLLKTIKNYKISPIVS